MKTNVLQLEVFGADASKRPSAGEGPPASAEDPSPGPRRDPALKPPSPAPAKVAAAGPGSARAVPSEELDALLARARGEGRAAGFEEGVAHAEAQGRADLRVILGELREALQDAVHARLAQDQSAATAARALAEALLSGVAPALARRGLAAEVAGAAADALRAARALPDAEAAPRVRVAPAQLDAVRTALEQAGLPCEVAADPELTELSARLDWAGGEDALDLDAALAAARAALERHAPEEAAAPVPAEPQAEERRTAHA